MSVCAALVMHIQVIADLRPTQPKQTLGEGSETSWVAGELDTRASRASALRNNRARRRSRIFLALSLGVMVIFLYSVVAV